MVSTLTRIKTKTVICKKYKGSDVITARESLGFNQREFAKKCYLSIFKYRKYEDGDFIIIPTGYTPTDQAEFDILQDALNNADGL